MAQVSTVHRLEPFFGGNTMKTQAQQNYATKRLDPRWQKKRLEILSRDEFTCRDCGDKDNTLHVHHCLYHRGAEPWEYENDELRTLCAECHERRAAIEHDVKLEFARLLAMLDGHQVENLMEQILTTKARGVENGVVIMSADMYSIETEVRWFQEAWRHPEFRPIYDSVTATTTDWKNAPAFRTIL